MLARERKARDDEPLVPHGLVSQALDAGNETSAEAPRSEVPHPTQPKPPRPATPAKPVKGSSGRLLHWPNVRKQVGSIPMAGVLPRLRALPKQISEQLKNARGRVNLSKHWTRIRVIAANGTNQLNKELRSLRARTGPELHEIRNSVQLPARTARLRQTASTGITKTVEKCQTWRNHAAAHFRVVKERSLLLTKAAVSHIAEKAPRDGFKLRIRFAGMPLKMRIAFARAKLEYELGRNSVAKDPRVWSPIALGAIAALLVMGLFATARHFAQASLPSNRVSASSSQDATPASGASIVPEPQKPAPAPVKAQLRIAAAKSDSAPTKLKPKPAAARSKVRRRPNGYVAKDTYVYYGSRASR